MSAKKISMYKAESLLKRGVTLPVGDFARRGNTLALPSGTVKTICKDCRHEVEVKDGKPVGKRCVKCHRRRTNQPKKGKKK